MFNINDQIKTNLEKLSNLKPTKSTNRSTNTKKSKELKPISLKDFISQSHDIRSYTENLNKIIANAKAKKKSNTGTHSLPKEPLRKTEVLHLKEFETKLKSEIFNLKEYISKK